MSENDFNPAVIEMRAAQVASLREATFTVLADVNWTVLPGEFWIVAGQQHSGKSDLLLHAAGLMVPARGRCAVFGCDTNDFGEAQIAERLRVGFVFPGGKLFNQLTLAENIALPLRYQKNLSAAEAGSRVQTFLELFELRPFADFAPSNLAVNWRQRAALARALILQPELLLLDNPLAGLGGRHRQWLLDFLNQLWNGHPAFGGLRMTIVVTADDLRPWRDPQKKFAVLDEKMFSIVGSWNNVAASHEHIVKELLAGTDSVTI
jgi:ABC-type transporter Mla maintaining outer membrane lipid asymmetry ATPase subunit MlaF